MMLSISERFNQTLENMPLKLDGDAEWDILLQQVVFGYNTSKHVWEESYLKGTVT